MNDNENKKTEELLNSMKAELFDPNKAENYRKAEEAATALYAYYTELQRAGFNRQEAFAMILALCGSK